ncbi:MAG: PLP-dependent aminotransferase family protein, partial [Geminicoccaceae bacterium]
FDQLFAADLPAPAMRWSGHPRFNFTGGHNDPEILPVEALMASAERVLRREGRKLACYNLGESSLGHEGLRAFVAEKLAGMRGIRGTADDILITSGSLQGLDLVNEVLLERGDTVIVEQLTYGGMITRLQRRGVRMVGVPLDEHGLRTDLLGTALQDLRARGIRPKYIYTIPTVQNPTATVLSLERRHELLRLSEAFGGPIFEDECYADLLWEGDWPAALRGLPGGEQVIHIGSFSKSLAPALRLGYVSAPWDVMSRLVACKGDGGTPAIEQMVVADFFGQHFEDHVGRLKRRLRHKLEALTGALEEQFGTAAEFAVPKGGIFLWVTLPEQVDTARLAGPALAEGIAYNPGPEWSTDAKAARHSMRLCFALPPAEEIREGIAKLALVCHRETGVPERG